MMFARRRQRLRGGLLGPQRLLHLIPNVITILSACAGLTAIRYAMVGRWELAVALIGAAAVLDGLDGRAARMLKSTSKLGEQLDSLADFLSFGCAPALIVYLWSMHEARGFGWAVALIFAIACALRLARFNTELDNPQKPAWSSFFFTGVPAPAGGALALAPMMLSFGLGTPDSILRHWAVTSALLLVVAGLMVSRIPTFSVKKARIRPEWMLPALLIGAAFAAFLVTEPWLTLSVTLMAYLVSIPFSLRAAAQLRRREAVTAPAPVAEPTAPAAGPPPAGGDDRVVNLDRRQPPRG